MQVLPCGVVPIPLNLNEAPAGVPDLPPLLEPVTQRLALPSWAGPDSLADFSLAFPPTLFFLAMLARATYAPNGDFFTRSVRAVVSQDAQITFVPNADEITPGTGLIVLPACAVVVISGTTNLGQWQQQIFLNGLVSTNYGTAGNADAARCAGVYKTAADNISTRIAAAVADKQLLIVGHSMGGAVAEVLAYKRRRAGRRGDKILTFAAPKPGDEALAAALPTSATFQRRLTNAGDFVPGLPPDLGAARLAVPLVLQPAAANWAAYRHPGQLYQLGTSGQLDPIDPPFLPLAIVGAMAAVAAGNPIDPAGPHLMSRFCTNLRAGFTTWNLPALRGWVAPAQLDDVAASLTALEL